MASLLEVDGREAKAGNGAVELRVSSSGLDLAGDCCKTEFASLLQREYSEDVAVGYRQGLVVG